MLDIFWSAYIFWSVYIFWNVYLKNSDKISSNSEQKSMRSNYFFQKMRWTLPNFFWNIEVWAVQKHVNLVDLVESFPTDIYLQILASTQQRTSLTKFDRLAEKWSKIKVRARYRTMQRSSGPNQATRQPGDFRSASKRRARGRSGGAAAWAVLLARVRVQHRLLDSSSWPTFVLTQSLENWLPVFGISSLFAKLSPSNLQNSRAECRRELAKIVPLLVTFLQNIPSKIETGNCLPKIVLLCKIPVNIRGEEKR